MNRQQLKVEVSEALQVEWFMLSDVETDVASQEITDLSETTTVVCVICGLTRRDHYCCEL